MQYASMNLTCIESVTATSRHVLRVCLIECNKQTVIYAKRTLPEVPPKATTNAKRLSETEKGEKAETDSIIYTMAWKRIIEFFYKEDRLLSRSGYDRPTTRNSIHMCYSHSVSLLFNVELFLK